MPGSAIANVSFSGIKNLNDVFGQRFVDHLLFSAKRGIRNRFDHTVSASTGYGRVARDDYKNLTFSFPEKTDVLTVLFGNVTDKAALIEAVLRENAAEVARVAREKGITEAEITSSVRKEFGFSVGISHVPQNAGRTEKISAFRDAELGSRKSRGSKTVEVATFNAGETLRISREAVSLETNLIREWREKRFTLDGTSYPAVVKLPSEGNRERLSPELLRVIRKKGAGSIAEASLGKDVERYIELLNSGFDFISPRRNASGEAETAARFETAIRSGAIPKEALTTTFKGARSKESLVAETMGKAGIRISVDVKDMGLMNLESFRRIARKVAGSGKGADPAVLEAGAEVTRAFASAVGEIRKRFSKAEIALGGDEILNFILKDNGD